MHARFFRFFFPQLPQFPLVGVTGVRANAASFSARRASCAKFASENSILNLCVCVDLRRIWNLIGALVVRRDENRVDAKM